MTNRKKIIAGNWKMNFGQSESLSYFQNLKTDPSHSIRLIFPPIYCVNPEVKNAAHKNGIELGAQNLHWEDRGAFTGELSGTVIKNELGINWVLIAHSERRQYFCETNETAALRFGKSITLGLNSIYCIGESLKEREAGLTEKILEVQTTAWISTITKSSIKNPASPIITSIAYEPVWAIGTGKTATPEQAQSAHSFIRSQVKKILGAEFSDKVSILYGGSVTPENIDTLISQTDIDGALVGGASLKPDSFTKILQST